MLKPFTHLKKTADRNNYAKVKVLMEAIGEKCKGLFPPGKSNVSELTVVENNTLFGKASMAFIAELYLYSGKPPETPPSDLICSVIFNAMQKKFRDLAN